MTEESRLLTLRPMRPDEGELQRRITYTALMWRPATPERPHPPPEEALAKVTEYHEGWGTRATDRGIVAEVDGTPVGGAWYRLFTSDRPGHGFVDEATPELGIGLFEGSRSTGIGRALLTALVAQARIDGYASICLAVGNENRARGLYESMGFKTVREPEGGQVMVLDLKGGA